MPRYVHGNVNSLKLGYNGGVQKCKKRDRVEFAETLSMCHPSRPAVLTVIVVHARSNGVAARMNAKRNVIQPPKKVSKSYPIGKSPTGGDDVVDAAIIVIRITFSAPSATITFPGTNGVAMKTAQTPHNRVTL